MRPRAPAASGRGGRRRPARRRVRARSQPPGAQPLEQPSSAGDASPVAMRGGVDPRHRPQQPEAVVRLERARGTPPTSSSRIHRLTSAGVAAARTPKCGDRRADGGADTEPCSIAASPVRPSGHSSDATARDDRGADVGGQRRAPARCSPRPRSCHRGGQRRAHVARPHGPSTALAEVLGDLRVPAARRPRRSRSGGSRPITGGRLPTGASSSSIRSAASGGGGGA